MQDNYDSMDDLEFDVLTEIGNIGAGNATTALSQLINTRIDMRVPQVRLLSFAELAEIIGGAETLVAGILLNLEGDINGSMLFVLERNDAKMMVQQLTGFGQPGETEFTDLDKSALQEVGNIISGAYLSAISSMTNLTISVSVPSLAFDMAGAILSVPAIEFGKMGDTALLIESQFKDLDVDISGYFILIPTVESYARILKSLGLR
ncbi:MAG: chemotaxis protein CheC [Lachnospiraceae bacterium]|nr:chemotaxis protein CheC [Lachnospiraceae bacterium]RKI28878.1 chemotaxis protein CheC [bacterium D16-36]RKI70268.1 chemotaxis protein CheC [bacterium 1xD8-6]